GLAAVGLTWNVRKARWWIVASVAMILCEGLFSMVYFWPRNTIMFIEGARVHSADVLRQAAVEFQRLHWARLAFNAASAAFVLVGLLKLYASQLAATPSKVCYTDGSQQRARSSAG